MTTTVGDTLYIKGAPEIVLDRCTIPAGERQQAEHLLSEWQQHAMRTLAIAWIASAEVKGLALAAISDPLRPTWRML